MGWIKQYRLLLAAAALGLFGISLAGYLWLRNVTAEIETRTMTDLEKALDTGDWNQAMKLIDWFLEKDPGNPVYLAQQARLAMAVQPEWAPQAWKTAIQQEKLNPEFRLARVLSLVRLDRLREARSSLEQWPGSIRESSAWWRASLALAAAEGDIDRGLEAVAFLRAQNPDHPGLLLNEAKLRLQSSNIEDRNRAKEILDSLQNHPDPEIAAEALREQVIFLIGEHKAPGRIAPLIDKMEKLGISRQKYLVTALELRQKANLPISTQDIEWVWGQLMEGTLDEESFQLLGWMNRNGRASDVIRLTRETGPGGILRYPWGFALAESILLTGDSSGFKSALAEVDWATKGHLKQVILYKFFEGQPGEAIWRARAIEQTGRRPDAWREVLTTLRIWRWYDGLWEMTMAALKEIPLHPAESALLFAHLERNGQTRKLLDLTQAFLRHEPSQPVLLNNAAYYAGLLGKDIPEAVGRIQSAIDSHPGQPQFLSTLAFLETKQGNLERAEANLASRPGGASEAPLVEAYLRYRMGADIPHQLTHELESATLFLPEEKLLRERIIKVAR